MLENYKFILPCTKKSLMITLQMSVITGFFPLPPIQQSRETLYLGELYIGKAGVKGGFNVVPWSRSQQVTDRARFES